MKGDYNKKKSMWVGYCVKGHQVDYFQSLRMYDSPPHCRDITSMVEKKMTGEDQLINRDFNLKQVREHDLLLLTSVKLNLKENEDIKKISTL